MRLPKDPENWRVQHVEQAIKVANRIFQEYENKYDADKPEETDDLYLQFLHAKQEAINIATVVEVRGLIAEANSLG